MILKNHPFAVEAFFESSIVLTYAIPKNALEAMIPPCLTLEIFNGKWAFIAVAMVQTKHLRPKGFPELLGNDFFLIGYRIFVRYTTSDGKQLRGLYILKSETDKQKMVYLGNLFTHYHYEKTDITNIQNGDFRNIISSKSNIYIKTNINKSAKLPLNSPFEDWKQARRFAGPLPFTFTYNELKKEVLIIQGIRENWTPQPIEILDAKIGFIENLGIENVILANAFMIENIPYYWQKGKIDKWQK